MIGEKIITHVYAFTNGQVMVFDQDGQQMPEFQGRYDEMKDKIKERFKGEIQENVGWRA